ncbi:MAG: VanZ family protein [Clostridiales bacterium]|nr:VanZ family protein [Clostridiales bacterium]
MQRFGKWTKWIVWVIFALYIAAVLRLTVFRGGAALYAERQLNLVLAENLIRVWQSGNRFDFFRQFWGNIGCFVPFGFLLPLLMKRPRFLTVAAIGAGFSLAIEVTQYFSRMGVAELDDLILNTLGVVIGYLIYRLWGMVTAKGEIAGHSTPPSLRTWWGPLARNDERC